MALYTLPKQYHPDFSNPRLKPVGPVEIDWTNPITHGLTHVWLFNDKRDLVGQFHWTKDEGQYRLWGDASLSGTNVVLTDGTEDALELGNTPIHNGALSVVVGGRINNTSGIRAIFSADSNTSTRREWQFRVSSDKLNFIPFVSNANGSVSGSTSITTGTNHVFAFTHDNLSSSNNIKVFLDGKLDGVGTFAGDLDADGAAITLGARSTVSPMVDTSSLTENTDGVWDFVLAWGDRFLSDAEQESIGKNPFQILKPQTPAMYFTASAVAGVNIPVIMHSYKQRRV